MPVTASRRRALYILLVIVVAAVGYGVARAKRDFYDFEVYRTASARLLNAESLYRPDEDGHYTFKYWPAFAIAMTPFAFIHPEAGKAIWYGVSVALLALLFRQSIMALPGRRKTVSALAWITFLLTGKFIVKELVNGQTNVLFAVCVLAGLIAAQRGRKAAAGAFLGLSVLVKPYGLLFLPWLLVSEGITAGAAATAVTGLGLLLPAAIYGWQGNLDLLTAWYGNVMGSTPANLLFLENISFATMWAKWLGPGVTASVLAAISGVLSLTLALFLWARRKQYGEPRYLEIGYLLLLVPLLSPQGWDYVLIVAMPAIVCVVDRFGTMPLPWRAAATVGLALTCLVIFDLVGRTLYFFLMDNSGTTIGALIVAGCMARMRARAAA